jgi:hypothetical protein
MMARMFRRDFLRSAALAVAAASPAGRASSQPRPFRVLLNSNVSRRIAAI